MAIILLVQLYHLFYKKVNGGWATFFFPELKYFGYIVQQQSNTNSPSAGVGYIRASCGNGMLELLYVRMKSYIANSL